MRLTQRKLSGAILITGALIRAYGMAIPSLWYDEAVSLNLTRLSVFEIARLRNFPLWEIVLTPFARISESVIMLRLPSLLCSIGALVILWLIMNELEFTDNQRLFASALAALLPGHFLIAQDARVYGLATLLIMLAMLFTIRGQLLGLTAVSGLMMYANPALGAFVTGSYLLALYKHPARWRMIILSGAGAIAARLPGVLNVIHVSTNPVGNFQLGPLSFNGFLIAFRQALWAEALPYSVPGVILLAIYIGIGLVMTITAATAAVIPAATMALVPLAIIVTYSVVITNVTHYRTLSLVLLPLALWIGAATAPKRWTPARFVLPALWMVLIVTGLIGWNPALKGAGLEAAAALVADDLSPADTVLYVTGTAALPVEHYLNVPHTAYILDANQHYALLPDHLADAFGYQHAGLEIDPKYIVYPLEPLISDDVKDQVTNYLTNHNSELVATLNYWQTAPIEIWRIDHND